MKKMKKINLIVISFLLLFTFACNSTNEIECSEQKNTEKFEGIIFSDGIETLSFNNYDDLIQHLEKSKKLNDLYKSKFEEFQNVISNIEHLNQINETQDSVVLYSCISKLYGSNNEINDPDRTLKSGIIADIFYTEELYGGDWMVMGTSLPILPTQFRQSISSVQAIAPVVLCSKTWFRGKHLVLWGSEMYLSSYDFDNLTLSFFML